MHFKSSISFFVEQQLQDHVIREFFDCYLLHARGMEAAARSRAERKKTVQWTVLVRSQVVRGPKCEDYSGQPGRRRAILFFNYFHCLLQII
jgi:hypothetical protein